MVAIQLQHLCVFALHFGESRLDTGNRTTIEEASRFHAVSNWNYINHVHWRPLLRCGCCLSSAGRVLTPLLANAITGPFFSSSVCKYFCIYISKKSNDKLKQRCDFNLQKKRDRLFGENDEPVGRMICYTQRAYRRNT